MEQDVPVTERSVARRGLIAGLASLGAAALLKLSGANSVEAADGENFIVGNAATLPAPPDVAGQESTHTTRLNYNVATESPTGIAFDVRHGTTASGQNIAGRIAIQASITSGNAGDAAILGRNNHTSGIAVTGTNPSGGVGVFGLSLLVGVRGSGFSNASNTIGIQGLSNLNAFDNGTGNGIGVHGKSGSGPGVKGESTSGAGVFGSSVSQPGVDGLSTNSLGIRGTSTNFVGIVGISTNSHGLYGSTASPGNYGIIAENTGGGGGLYVTGNAFINGSLQVTGAKNAVIKMQDGSEGVVYCQEAPEPYFEDFGRAQLAGGVANVQLEREFAALVAGTDYMVFLTPSADTRGLFVTHQGPNSFDVRECQGGTSSIPFTYRIVTRRRDIEGKRFARVSPEPRQKVAATRAALGTPRHDGP